MKKFKKGFTLVEIALFLAVTSILFVGIVVGTQNSIWQQRYNDSVQSFTNFIRNIYSEVSNPQSFGDGRSDLAIYGKLIVFGQVKDLDGMDIDAGSQKVFVYDVMGDANGAVWGGDITKVLKRLGANVVMTKTEEDGTKQVVPLGAVETYAPIWSAAIEDVKSTSSVPKMFEGAILIVKHPKSGTINTVYYDQKIDINEKINEANGMGDYARTERLLVDYLDNFKVDDVDFCINPYGYGGAGSLKRNVRIIKNARNSSGVKIIDLNMGGDDGDRCKKD